MGARILVADDSVTIQKVVELTFSKEDFVLEQARSGDETIRKAKEMRPDLVLVDLVMPDMNGYDVCAALRADPALRSVPVILLAGAFETFDHQRAAQVGANDFVTKPFESQVLVGKVKQLLFAKTMEAKNVGTAARLAAGAVTVTISPAAAAAARVAVPRSPDVAPPAERSAAPQAAPAPEAEELWNLLGEPAASAVSQSAERVDAFPGSASAPGGVAATPPDESLDLGTPDLEPLPSGVVSGAEAMDDLPLPESLSLDDLLAAGPASAAAAVPAEPVRAEAEATEPVYELSDTSAALLPMVEAGKGEPPALSVDDLLLPAGDESAPEDTLTMELPEFDLAPLPGADAAAADLDAAPPEVLHEAAGDGGLSFQDAGGATGGAVEPGPPVAAAAERFEFLPAPQVVEEPSAFPEPLVGESVAEPVVSHEAEFAAEPPAAVPAALPVEQPAPVVPAAVSPADMAAMREAVTERVASELRRELSEKLLDRFEKVVWEVVPDLAEILIAKEIERIRRLAEEEKPS